MEDNTKQPPMADASLYNGQPTDTGSLCPSARLTPCTPSISDDVKDGVSVENVPTQSTQWYVFRVSYGRILKAKEFVEAKGLECYVPLRYKDVGMLPQTMLQCVASSDGNWQDRHISYSTKHFL